MMTLADKSKLMLAALKKMCAAGLSTYGRFGVSDAKDNETAIAYAEVAVHLGCDFAYLPAAAVALCAHGGDFPDARKVADALLDAERKGHVTIGVPTEGGRVALVKVPKSECPVEHQNALLAECSRLGLPLPLRDVASTGASVPMARLEAHPALQTGLKRDSRGTAQEQPRDYGDVEAERARQLARLGDAASA